MSDRSAPAHGGIAAGQVAEIIVALGSGAGQRGSGYQVGPAAVLTAAHVLDGAVSVQVRFDADRPGEWVAEVISCWIDPRSDLAVLTIAPREGGSPVTVARFGRLGDRAAVLAVRAVGFPRSKLKADHDDRAVYRDSHQADGSVAVLSNRREGTLEITVPPPARDPEPDVSPWEGMSGAAVWVGGRIVGVIAHHHRSDGLRRLAAARLDLALEGLDASRRAELSALIDLPDVLPDVVPPSAGDRVRTAYQAQVRDIAPDQLLDREAELDELVGFCAGDQAYAWWQAGPWAGKSALMAWFMLHPPAGVDVVSFFVTARLAGQSDSDACTDALIEQLAALLGESPAGLLTAGARRGTMLKLLDDVARRSREVGRRLLLVIDGLDEDSGTGSSIAALLPRRPPPEVRVLVASRPHPPVPDDVAGDHPLRTITPRQLAVSEHARDVERRAKHELTQLLAGSQLQRDVLGLLTAAGGGLTLGDLEELAKRPSFEIEHMLGGVFGRSVDSRAEVTSAGYLDDRMYLFTHETLRVVAEHQYGKSLAAYRDRIHAWADSYRRRNWPAETPHYLLRSYPRTLASSGDVTRLVSCATDQARHNRIREVTGGDSLALTEINAAQQLILAQSDPDLTSLALLAVQRDDLINRNSDIPIELPAVWAMLGQPTSAEALANSISRPERRVEALAQLAEVATAGGNDDQAFRMFHDAEVFSRQITYSFLRLSTTFRLAEAAFRLAEGTTGHDGDRAARLVGEVEMLVGQLTEPDERDERIKALTRLAGLVATGGDSDRATQLADEVETLTRQITEPDKRVEALIRLAGVMAAGGNGDRATQLADEVETLTRQITEADKQAAALALLSQAVAGDDHERAVRLADEVEILIAQISEPDWQAEALAWLAEVAADAGDYERAARLAREAETFTKQVTDRDSWRWAMLKRLAEVVADHDQVEALTRYITEPHQRVKALTQLAKAVANAGNHDRAARLAREAETFVGQGADRNSWRSNALNQLAEVVAADGDHDRAEVITGHITEPYQRVQALTRLAKAVAVVGDHERAARLAREAEALTGQITISPLRTWALVGLAGAGVATGDQDRAEALVGQITEPGMRVEALTRLAGVVADAGDREQAIRLVFEATAEAEALAGQSTDPDKRVRALARLAELVAAGGDHDRAARLVDEAEALVGQITDPGSRVEALTDLGELVANAGDHERAARLVSEAEALVGLISHPSSRWWALFGLAKAMATDGDLDRVEALAEQVVNTDSGQITDPELHAWKLFRLAAAMAAGGKPDRVARLADKAKALTGKLSYHGWQAQDSGAEALVGLTKLLVGAGEETSPVPESACNSSPLMGQARRLVAAALATGPWNLVVAGLVRVDPLALTALADEVQVRWG